MTDKTEISANQAPSTRPPSRHLRILAGQTVIYGLGTIVPKLLSYLLTPFYTRIFINELQAQFADLSIIFAYVSLCNILYTYGLETAYFRFINRHPEQKNIYTTALLSLFSSTLVFTTALLLFASQIAALVGVKNPQLIRFSALIIAFDAIAALPLARLRQQKKALRFAFIRIAGVIIHITLVFALLWLFPLLLEKNPSSALSQLIASIFRAESGIYYALLANLIASLATVLLLWPQLISPLRHGKPYFDMAMWRKLLQYALPVFVAGFAAMINDTSNRIFLKWWLPGSVEHVKIQIAIYSAVYRLSLLMTIFVQGFRLAAEPFFFEQHKEKDSRATYALVMKWFVLFCLLIFLGVMFFLPVITKVFLGIQYRKMLHIVPILLWAYLFFGVYYNLSVWYKLIDKTSWGMYIACFGAGLTIALNRWWIPLFGPTGAALATLVCYVAMMLISYYFGQRHFSVPYETGRILAYMLASLCFWGVYIALGAIIPNPMGQYALGIALLGIFALFILRNERPH